MPTRKPAKPKRIPTSPGDDEVVEIRLIARDGLVQTLAAQIAAALPGSDRPRFYPSHRDPGRTRAYITAYIPPQSALDRPPLPGVAVDSEDTP